MQSKNSALLVRPHFYNAFLKDPPQYLLQHCAWLSSEISRPKLRMHFMVLSSKLNVFTVTIVCRGLSRSREAPGVACHRPSPQVCPRCIIHHTAAPLFNGAYHSIRNTNLSGSLITM